MTVYQHAIHSGKNPDHFPDTKKTHQNFQKLAPAVVFTQWVFPCSFFSFTVIAQTDGRYNITLWNTVNIVLPCISILKFIWKFLVIKRKLQLWCSKWWKEKSQNKFTFSNYSQTCHFSNMQGYNFISATLVRHTPHFCNFNFHREPKKERKKRYYFYSQIISNCYSSQVCSYLCYHFSSGLPVQNRGERERNTNVVTHKIPQY